MADLYVLRIILEEVLELGLEKTIECSYFCLKKKLKVIFLHLSPLIARTYVDLCLRKLDYHICENSNKEYENVEKLKYFSRSFK